MSIIAQRHGVRLVTFQRCGHTSLINSFKTQQGSVISRGQKDLDNVLVGRDTEDWPEPVVSVCYFRHPLARLASTYLALVKQNFREQFAELGMTQLMTYEQFLENLFDIDLSIDAHLRPQSETWYKHAKSTWWRARLEEIRYKWPHMVNTFSMNCVRQPAHFNQQQAVHVWPLYYRDLPEKLLHRVIDLYSQDAMFWETS